MSLTTNEYMENLYKQFRSLSPRYRAKLVSDAKGFIFRNPGCADHSRFWRGLSARQVIEANHNAQ